MNSLDLWTALGSGNRLTHEEGIHSVAAAAGSAAAIGKPPYRAFDNR